MEPIDLPPPFNGMKYVPFGASYMLDVFAGCVSWAASCPEIQKQFTKDTGLSMPIEKMIDQATGYDIEAERKRVALAFMDWVVINLWGEENDAGASAIRQEV